MDLSFKGGGGVNQFAAIAINEFMKSGIGAHIDEQNETLHARSEHNAIRLELGRSEAGDEARKSYDLFVPVFWVAAAMQ